jgi:hypothetical protein
VNARALALAGLSLAIALAVFLGLRWLGRGDARPREIGAAERSGRDAPPPRPVDAFAGEFLRPGALSAAHAHLEGAERCTLCHGRASAVPDERCEACHEQIPQRAARRLPLHGTFDEPCAHCHAEHRGSEVELIDLDREAFAHSTTRFELHGAHARLDCDACHTLRDPGSGRADFHFQGVPFAGCRSCHADPHAGGVRAGESVAELVRVELDASEPPLPARDPAHPIAGRDCKECHTETGFRSAGLRQDGFAHASDTRFELHGAHQGVACGACHTPELRELEQRDALPPGSAAEPDCGSCHRDPHAGALGSVERCAGCHSPEGWSQGFDHARDTRFALDELHAALRCESCHSDKRFRAQGRDCQACHRDAADLLAGRFDAARGEPDPHQGALECSDCHTPTRAGNRPAALAARCAGCHDASYSALLATWRARLDEAAVHARGDAQRIERLRRSGPHGFALALELLRGHADTAR